MILNPCYPFHVCSSVVCLQGVELKLPTSNRSQLLRVKQGRRGLQKKISVDWRQGLSGMEGAALGLSVWQRARLSQVFQLPPLEKARERAGLWPVAQLLLVLLIGCATALLWVLLGLTQGGERLLGNGGWYFYSFFSTSFLPQLLESVGLSALQTRLSVLGLRSE